MSEIDDLRRLVQRTFEFQRSTVIERRVPEKFTDLFPIPPNATLLGSVMRGEETDPEQITTYLDAPGSADAIKSWFDTRMASLGYRPHVPQQPRGSPGGFRHTMSPFGQSPVGGGMYCKGPDAPYYSLALRGGKDLQQMVLSWHGGDQGWNPCAPQPPAVAAPTCGPATGRHSRTCRRASYAISSRDSWSRRGAPSSVAVATRPRRGDGGSYPRMVTKRSSPSWPPCRRSAFCSSTRSR